MWLYCFGLIFETPCDLLTFVEGRGLRCEGVECWIGKVLLKFWWRGEVG